MSLQPEEDQIVISGMAGLYPEANNIKEFADILYNRTDPVNDKNSRWSFEHPDAPRFLGKAPELETFDAQFLMVHPKLGNTTDIYTRKLLEQTYHAILDAGINPIHLSGKKIGVYIGCGGSELEKAGTSLLKGFSIVGTSKAMAANRISYCLNFKGPSMSVDASCCGSLVALKQAFSAMKRGDCEAAVVGSAHTCNLPHTMVAYGRYIKMSRDGKTKSFDENADGTAHSEAINVLFLQKAKDALRIYAQLVNVAAEFGHLTESECGHHYGLRRNPTKMAKFINSFYDEVSVTPDQVEYVEAVGSGMLQSDKDELEAIAKVYCKKREANKPLLVGSVTSNIGYVESALGIAAISKILLGYQKGKIAGNLHYETPRKDIAAIKNKQIEIVDSNRPFGCGYAAVNSISITGVVGHVLLKGYDKLKLQNDYKTSLPYLVAISGRQVSVVDKALIDIKSRPVDPEELALLRNIHETNIPGYLGRGFVILDQPAATGLPTVLSETVEHFDTGKKPLWFVYSGMGSQWVAMGAQLMRIPTFAGAIERCHKILEEKGLNLLEIITSTDKGVFDNVLNIFVGITAIQIGLTDILFELGLEPDNIVGHSLGETGCAYADGCLTLREAILAAYYRGLVSLETPFVRGAMAAVGLGYDKVSKLCPPEIEVACHNGPDSSTISGSEDKIQEFVADLTANNIFVREVSCSNIAYHSRYISEAGPAIMKYFSEIITSPKRRSKKWLTTSVPKDKIEEDSALYCSAEYLANNFLNPVLFEEIMDSIPTTAVVVEIAPHGLLQPILKRSLPESCSHIPLTLRNYPDSAVFLLEAIGKLYIEGFNPKIGALYPKVHFPVSTSTPVLSHLIGWAHEEKWETLSYAMPETKTTSACNFLISIHEQEYKYLSGHVINNKILFPLAGALVAVWDTLAMVFGKTKKQFSVEFRDVHLYSQPIILNTRPLKLRVSIQRGCGGFEVTHGLSLIAKGFVFIVKFEKKPETQTYLSKERFNSDYVYDIFFNKGYHYNNDFRSICSSTKDFTEGFINWNNNWVTFLDGLIQFNVLNHSHDYISQPKHINRLLIDINKHLDTEIIVDNQHVMRAFFLGVSDCVRCGGVTIENIKYNNFLNPKKNIDRTDKKGHLFCLQKLLPNNDLTIQFIGINELEKYKPTTTLKSKSCIDFCGVSKTGSRVMGIIYKDCQMSKESSIWWPVPRHWTSEDAATVPLPYAQAFYYLGIKTNLRFGQSILIHEGTGALGQASISIALGHRCEVFTTVSDMRQKRFLKKLFPELKDDHIGCSVDISFYNMIKEVTKGIGVDIVLNCLIGELKHVSLNCAIYSGTAIDVSQIESNAEFNYGMYHMFSELNYLIADFSSIFLEDHRKELEQIRMMVSEGIDKGYVKPLTRVIYKSNEEYKAIKLLKINEYRGRILLESYPDSKIITQESNGVIIPEYNLIEEIDDIFGINFTKEATLNTTLLELGIKHQVLDVVQEYFRDMYNIFLTRDTTSSLTPKRIKQIQNMMKEAKNENVRGLKTLFSSVLKDEIDALREIVLLPNLQLSSTVLEAENFALLQDKDYLCIIPGLEGQYKRFLTLSKRLKMLSFVLQPGLNNFQETVDELAQRLAKTLIKHKYLRNDFHLLGYESGVVIALKIAAIFEKHGVTGKVFCLGGGPNEIKEELNIVSTFQTECQLQNAIIEYMFQLMVDGPMDNDLKASLIHSVDWEHKINACVESLRSRVPYSLEYSKDIIQSAYFRIKQITTYVNKTRTLESEIILLRPISQTENICTDYMQHYSKKPVKVYDLETTLAYCVNDLRCAACINQNLSQKFLDEYKKKNLCERYVVKKALRD